MPEAKLSLTIPEVAWPGAVTQAYPESTIRILATMAEPNSGVGLAEITHHNLDAVLRTIRDHDAVGSVELLQRTAEECLLQFRTDLPLLLFAARDSGLPLEMPFEIKNGEATWTLTATQDSISELGDQLSALGVSYTVEYLQQDIATPEDLLTDRQRFIVAAAIDNGYYDTPRGCSLTELADVVDLAKSTVSETLHRAEEQVMKEFAATAFETDPSPTIQA